MQLDSLIHRDPSQGQELGSISRPGLQPPRWRSLTHVLTQPPASPQHCLPGDLTRWDFSCSCCKSPWLGASCLEPTAASQGNAPSPAVAECGCTCSVVSVIAQVALAQVAWPVLAPPTPEPQVPTTCSPHPLACSPVIFPTLLVLGPRLTFLPGSQLRRHCGILDASVQCPPIVSTSHPGAVCVCLFSTEWLLCILHGGYCSLKGF